jgi:hypothetical protein
MDEESLGVGRLGLEAATRAELLQLLEARRFEEAHELLRQRLTRKERPSSELLHSIGLLEERLVRHYAAKLGNLRRVPSLAISRRTLGEVGLSAAEWLLLGQVDGQKTLGEILRTSPLGRFGTYRTLAGLFARRLLEHDPPPQPSQLARGSQQTRSVPGPVDEEAITQAFLLSREPIYIEPAGHEDHNESAPLVPIQWRTVKRETKQPPRTWRRTAWAVLVVAATVGAVGAAVALTGEPTELGESAAAAKSGPARLGDSAAVPPIGPSERRR